MRTASRITLALAGASILLAVWTPVGSWWQWTITAILFALAGAGFGASADMPRQQDRDNPTGNSTGPHVHFDKRGYMPSATTVVNPSGKPEQIVRPDHPTYGKPSKENDR